MASFGKFAAGLLTGYSHLNARPINKLLNVTLDPNRYLKDGAWNRAVNVDLSEVHLRVAKAGSWIDAARSIA